MTRTMELFFHDLTEEAQARLLEFLRLEDEAEGNLEYVPLTVLEVEDEEAKDE